MAKILTSKIDEDLKYIVEIQVEPAEYNDFKNRILTQLAKGVEVPGFRKGKAPLQVSLGRLDPVKVQTTVIQETVEKFYRDLRPEIEKDLNEKKTLAIFSSASLLDKTDSVSENKDGSFKFTLEILTLAKVDLNPLLEKEQTLVSKSDLVNETNYQSFLTTQHQLFLSNYNDYSPSQGKAKAGDKILANIKETLIDTNFKNKNTDGKEPQQKTSQGVTITLGLNKFPPEFEEKLEGSKAGEKKIFELDLKTTPSLKSRYKFEIEILEVSSPVFKTLPELFENKQSVKKQFVSIESLDTELKAIYDRKINEELNSLIIRQVVDLIISEIPEFKLPKSVLEQESERIITNLKQRALKSRQSLVEVFLASGLPSTDKIKTDADVVKNVNNYVSKELKLIEVLRFIYYSLVSEKISETELKNLEKNIKENPQKFSVNQQELETNQLTNIAFDRLLRQKSLQWLIENMKFKSSGNSDAAKSEKNKKTTSKKNTKKNSLKKSAKQINK